MCKVLSRYLLYLLRSGFRIAFDEFISTGKGLYTARNQLMLDTCSATWRQTVGAASALFWTGHVLLDYLVGDQFDSEGRLISSSMPPNAITFFCFGVRPQKKVIL